MTAPYRIRDALSDRVALCWLLVMGLSAAGLGMALGSDVAWGTAYFTLTLLLGLIALLATMTNVDRRLREVSG